MATKKQGLEAINQKQEVRNKFFLASCLVPVFFLFIAGCNKQEEEKVISPNEVAIKINDREITHGEFQDTFKRLFLEGEAAEIKDEELKNLKMALVNQFIEEELILEEA